MERLRWSSTSRPPATSSSCTSSASHGRRRRQSDCQGLARAVAGRAEPPDRGLEEGERAASFQQEVISTLVDVGLPARACWISWYSSPPSWATISSANHRRRQRLQQVRRPRRHALSAGAERLPAHRPRQGDLRRLRPGARVRRHLQPPLRRHQPDHGRRRVRRGDPGRRPLARLRVGQHCYYASDYFEQLYRAAPRS